MPLQVIATDAGGAPLPCVPVTFAAPGAGASATLSATTVVTNMQGVAKVTATANATLGAYAISASAPGLPAVQFNLANLTALPVTAPIPTLGPGALLVLVVGVGLMAMRLRRRRG